MSGPPDVRTPGEVGTGQALKGTNDDRIVAQDECRRLDKSFASLAAALALKGYTLHELACGGFLISRWDATAHCSDLAAVHGFLRRIGGAA